MRPKAHHKVPRFYLEGFRTDHSGTGKKARIWVYRDGASEPRRCNPSKTAFETDFYALISPDGQRDATLEHLLEKYVDTPTSKIWSKLTDDAYQLAIEERTQVAIFIAFLFTRTSTIRRFISQFHARLEDMATRLMDVAEQRIQDDPTWRPGTFARTPGAPRFVFKSREDLEASRPTHNNLVLLTTTGIEDLSTIIANMNWTILHGPLDTPFITSDNPVARENPFVDRDWLSADIELDGAEISVPLSKHCCLMCSHHWPEGHVQVEADTVRFLNQRTMEWYESEVYASRCEDWLEQAFLGALGIDDAD